jgi:uncharacterized membrane protein YozB (DUF420 family)
VSPLAFLIVPFSTIVVFPILIGAALKWRRRTETHKRLMLIWGGLFLVGSQGLRIVAGETAVWQAFARWFIS